MLLKSLIGVITLSYPMLAMTTHANLQDQDIRCLVSNLFFEARGEGVKGMQAVSNVTINRVRSTKYPNSICAVVFQRKQFSWTKQEQWSTIEQVLRGDIGASKRFNQKDVVGYYQALEIASKAVLNPSRAIVVVPEDTLWYHAEYVRPSWASRLKKIKKVGKHVFYTKV